MGTLSNICALITERVLHYMHNILIFKITYEKKNTIYRDVLGDPGSSAHEYVLPTGRGARRGTVRPDMRAV